MRQFWGQMKGRAAKAPVTLRAAGRRWQASNPATPLDGDARMDFAIPLIPRARARDWALIERNLAATLSSVLAQDDPRWHATICCQDRPALPDDPRISFLPFAEPPRPAGTTDRPPKMRALRRALATDGRDGYLFMLDADDILHPGLVGHAMTAAHPHGYVLGRGWMMDVETGAIADLAPRTLWNRRRDPFHMHCGSCSALRFDRRAGDAWLDPLDNVGSHNQQLHNLAAYGIRPEPVPFHAAVYLVNHGENMREKRGRMDPKFTYLVRNAVSSAQAAEIRRTFAL